MGIEEVQRGWKMAPGHETGGMERQQILWHLVCLANDV